MNFFGHAVVACWRSDAPPFVLGAMAPDLAGMCGGRITGASHAELSAGIDWHHRCDGAFHRLDAFRELMAQLSERLRGRGVSRGPSLGAAHVAVELLLDGCLLDDDLAGVAYASAIARAGRGELGDHLEWTEPSAADRFEWLRERLQDAGLPIGYRDPAIVANRVARALSRRPLLALGSGQLPVVARELTAFAPEVAARAGEIMAALSRALT